MTNSIPNSKTIAHFIQKNSPKGAKCIDADCVQVKNLYIIAWVLEKAISQNQGYYQAMYTTYQNGCFSLPEGSLPCRYYDDGKKKKITSSPFCSEQDGKKDLISTKNDTQYTDTYITLICYGRAMSQLYMRIDGRER